MISRVEQKYIIPVCARIYMVHIWYAQRFMRDHSQFYAAIHSVLEFAVLVLAKQCRSHTWQSLSFEQSQSLLECIVDVDLAIRVE